MLEIFSPSYGRPDDCITHEYLKELTYVVSEREAEAYRKVHDKVITVPDEVQGSYARVCNYILENNQDKKIVIMDDDISAIRYYENREVHTLSEEEVYATFENNARMTDELGAKYWGLNILPDKQAYREYSPFSTVSYCGGPVQGFVYNDLLFDEDMLLKEDYDMTLQQLNKYRKVLRFNKYHYVAKQSVNVGGCATYRTYEEEKKRTDMLQKKWGDKIVKYDKSDRKGKNFDYNPIITPPIKGI